VAGMPGYPRVDDPDSRDRFLKRAIVVGGTLLVGGAAVGGLPRLASSAQSPEQDAEIFNFALVLEQLQAAFYDEAVAQATLPAELLEFARVASGHERQHVSFLQEALGMSAREAPETDFGEATIDSEAFAAAAASLEDLAVAAYNGQGPNLTKPALAAAGKIVSVEARHASWIRDIAGRNPAPKATDPTLPAAAVMARLNRIADIKAR
jgi:Ferritin-like domain